MKYEYIGEQSITIHGIGEAGARMSEIALPTDAEGQDLGWHALNYRTAHTMHAQAMYEELERYVRAAILAERERCIRIAEGDYEHLTVGIDPHASVGRMIAAAIRRGSV